MTKLLATIAIIIFCTYSLTLKAQNHGESPEGSISLATNPAYFVLGGYHFKPSYHFPKKWSVGATWQGGFELPSFARDQFFNSNNDGVTVDWVYAIGAEVKYRFSDAAFDKGFYAAFNLGYESWEVKQGEAEDNFDNWFSSIDFGYNWYPFKKEQFHVGLSYTLIFILNNTEDRNVGDAVYNINTIVRPSFIPTILIGWRF